jgi:hypothetical protein
VLDRLEPQDREQMRLLVQSLRRRAADDGETRPKPTRSRAPKGRRPRRY